MLPTVIVAGSLGAGKTTLVNQTIAACPELRVAVIENEAGDVSIDRDLLRGAARVVDVLGGCACCSVRGELHAALELLADRAGEIDAVIVEASGIADPVAIIQAFQVPFARTAFRLTGLACVVDTSMQEDAVVLARQLRHADLAVLTKSELSSPAVVARTRHAAAAFGSRAQLAEPESGRELMVGYLRAPTVKLLSHLPQEQSEAGPSPHGFTAVTVAVEGELDRHALERWLSLLPLMTGEVLRVKGVVALVGSARPQLIQGVGPRAEIVAAPKGGTTLRRNRIVIIGRGLARGELQTGLEGCRARAVRHA